MPLEEKHGVLQTPLLSISGLPSRNNRSLSSDMGAQLCKVTLSRRGWERGEGVKTCQNGFHDTADGPLGSGGRRTCSCEIRPGLFSP